MKNKKRLVKQHASQYIAAVFETSLRNASFVCPNNDLLCWYRIRSPEVFNSIIFSSPWSVLPLFLNISYGIIPSFEMPIHTKSVVYNQMHDEELFAPRSIVENYSNGGTMAQFSDDIWVYAPIQDGRGIYTFEELLLPDMDRIHTIQETYYFHKDRRLNNPLVKKIEDYNSRMQRMVAGASKTFINMALWVDDKEIYPYAIPRVNERLMAYQNLCRRFPQRQNYQQELSSWQSLQDVLENGNRDLYLQKLAQRMDPNARLIQRKYLMGQSTSTGDG